MSVELPYPSTAETSDNGLVVVQRGDLTPEQEKRFTTIKRLHVAAAAFMLIQTIAYIVIGGDANASPSIGFSDRNETTGEVIPSVRALPTFNPLFLVPLFTGLAALDHIICSVICYKWPDTAKEWIFVRRNNPLRWAEYTFSSSIMLLMLAVLCGITDVHIWYMITTMNALGMLTGQLSEMLPRPAGTKESSNNASGAVAREYAPTLRILLYLIFTAGVLLVFLPWGVLLCYFTKPPRDFPDFVWAAFLVTLVFFAAFGTNAFLHNILGLYDFPTAEIVYLALSFTAKTFLAGDVFGGLQAST